jgi:hypothetical protein
MANSRDWINLLDDEDLAFLKRFVLASGSLKEVAQEYGISYPTVRLRLDRLIAKVEIFDSQRPMDDFERTLRAMHVDGKIDHASMKTLLSMYDSQKENGHATTPALRPDAAPARREASGGG